MAEVSYLYTTINGVTVVTTPTEIDVTTADHLREALLRAASCGHATVVVDLTGTRYCDSAGLRTLLQAHRRVAAEGGELRLVIPAGGAVRRTLTVTGLDRLMPCFTSLEEARGA